MADAEDQEIEPGGVRPFWSGTITFGLVSVPVSLFPANRSGGVGMRMVTPDGTPVERRYVCSKEQVELDWEDIVRGYEVSKGKFVVVTEDELEALEPRKSRDIDLRLFVRNDEIDPIYFERAYFLVPASGSNKAYRLLAKVMEDTDHAGIATFVMREKEYLVAILAKNGILHAETMRFEDEIRKPADVDLPKKSKSAPALVKKFEAEIAKRVKKVDFSEFLDDYGERLEKLAQQKRKKKAAVIKTTEPVQDEGAEVIDLLEVLSRSLKPAPGSKRKKSA